MDPLAEQLAEELRATAGQRKRLLAVECDDALVEVAPWTRSDPGRRRRLGELIAQLEDAGELARSVSVDNTARPELPKFVTLTGGAAEPVEPAGVGYPWRPELEWAHSLRLTAAEFETLVVVQKFLRDHPDAPKLAHRERSLQLFGHEKRIDRLVRSRLFEDGRLSLGMLACWWAPPPIAWRGLAGRGSVVVSENAAGYHAVAAAWTGRVTAVAYGAGGAFAQSVASLVDIGDIERISYIGDLDAEGVAIPQRAAEAAAAVGLPAPAPDVAQWEALVGAAESYGQKVEPIPAEVAGELCAWFGDSRLGMAVRGLLHDGIRVPQEVLTASVLELI